MTSRALTENVDHNNPDAKTGGFKIYNENFSLFKAGTNSRNNSARAAIVKL